MIYRALPLSYATSRDCICERLTRGKSASCVLWRDVPSMYAVAPRRRTTLVQLTTASLSCIGRHLRCRKPYQYYVRPATLHCSSSNNYITNWIDTIIPATLLCVWGILKFEGSGNHIELIVHFILQIRITYEFFFCNNQSSRLCGKYWNSKAVVIISSWSCVLYYQLRVTHEFTFQTTIRVVAVMGYWNSKAIVIISY